MQKNRIEIAKKTLNLLDKNSWDKIPINKILSSKLNVNLKNKTDLLININRYFDYLLKNNLSSIEKSSSKDMLFEVLMARLDILNMYRKSIKNLLKYLLSHPQDSIKLIPSFSKSIILIATLADIEMNGIKGLAKLKTIFLLYVVIIYTWEKDETDSLEKTMTILDKYLENLDKLIKLI